MNRSLHHPDIAPPSLRTQLGETVSGLELASLLLNWKKLQSKKAKQTKGATRTVMVVPGFYGGELSIAPLKQFLRYQGHRSYSWGQGLNRGNINAFISPLIEKLHTLNSKYERPVSLVGWSLGGIISRELARHFPDRVEQVITLGSPVIGGPKVTALKRLSPLFGWNQEDIEEDMRERFKTPIERPITAIYSKADGIVAWQACIDSWSPNVRHVEVAATHIGMGFNPQVYEIVANTLAKKH